MTCLSISMPLGLRMLAFSVLLLVVGCKEKPLAQSALGSTGITVTLHAPNEKGHYRYSISNQSGALLHRFLGPAMTPNPAQPHVTPEASGWYRVTWGSGAHAGYTLIDTKQRKVISDSNQANSEQSF
jgi:hypothetical protein